MIDGLLVLDCVYAEDDRGSLVRMGQNYQLPGGGSPTLVPMEKYPETVPGKFGQVYVVHSPTPGTIRGFHKHFRLWDYFYVSQGAAKFVFVDDRKGGISAARWDLHENFHVRSNMPNPGETQITVTSGRRPKLVVVPPGVFHGWVSLEPDTFLVSLGSELFDPTDEVRVPPNYFNDEFGGDPFEVKGR